MDDSVRQNSSRTPDKNRGGRPRITDTPANAIRMQRMLMQLRSALPHTSMISGRPLTMRGYACWIYWRDQQYPPAARHGLVPPPTRGDHLEKLRSDAQRDVRRAVLHRIDGYIGSVDRGQTVMGARLRAERAYAPESFRVGGLPGLYWGDVGIPIGDGAGEPSFEMVEAVTDAVEVVQLSLDELETLRQRYAVEVDQISVAERVAELLGEHGALTAERTLYRRLQLAGVYEFVHLGCAKPDGTTPTGKRLSPGALERHHRRAA